MKRHHEKKTVPFSAEQIFDLVVDVERYPEFIPWCEKITITKRWQEGDTEFVDASMTAAFKVFRETVHTRVTMKRTEREVIVDYLDGPFKHLHNVWKLSDREQGGCLIDFYIEFEFRSRLLQMAIQPIFSEAVYRMVGAFDRRAHAVYGES